jgi:acyl-CoA reductase-like NAD-dependent aldehyde dehydrogenase
MAIFFNTGQDCCAGSRLLVQESVYDKFVQLLTERVAFHKVGDPFDKDVSALQNVCAAYNIVAHAWFCSFLIDNARTCRFKGAI